MLSKLLYADDLVLMGDMTVTLRNKFLVLREAFESKGLKVNLGITMVIVSDGITRDVLSKSKFDPYGVCRLRVKTNNRLYIQWIHGRCVKVKRVAA